MAHKRQLWIFFGAVICVGASMGVHESIFNNFLSDTFNIKADHRGWLEFPRELPGLLVVLMAGALAALPVARLGVVGGVVLAIGLVGLMLFGGTYWPMVGLMILTSAGMHLLMPVRSSIAIGLSNEKNKGRQLGVTGAVDTLGVVLGSGCVWLLLDKAEPQYRAVFGYAALAAGAGALVYGLMHLPHLHQARPRFVMRRRYGLYYLLELFFGARKQIFITFGPWVLISVYGESAKNIAGLFAVAAVIGIGFKPLVGMAIDRFGERNVLVADGLILAVVCLGYGFAGNIMGDESGALRLARGCFILDNLLFALGTGRVVYVSRLTGSPLELTSTLSMGISVNHLASMLIPTVAGLIWVTLSYQSVFLAAALLALSISVISSFVPSKQQAIARTAGNA